MRFALLGLLALAAATPALLRLTPDNPLHALVLPFGPHIVAAVGLCAVAVLLSRGRGRRRLSVAAAGAILLGVPGMQSWNPLPQGSGRPATAGVAVAGPVIKAVSFNVEGMRNAPATAAAWLAEADADIIGLVEGNRDWLEALPGHLPHRVIVPEESPGTGRSLILASRWPIASSVAFAPGGSGRQALLVRLTTSAGTADAVVAHAPNPLFEPWKERQDYFAGLARRVAAGDRPLVLMGDFDTDPRDPTFPRFLAASGLGSVAQPPASWPTPAGAFGIAIDHVLGGNGLTPLTLERGPALGSDHYPVTATLAAPTEAF